MTNETKYYNKILDAWIAKMKDKGFKFTIEESLENNGIELVYSQSENKTFDCLIVDYDSSNFNVTNLHDRLHKLELLIPRLDEIYNNNIKQKGNEYVINFSYLHIINLSYLLYTNFNGPYLIETKGEISDVKNYYTYIDDNGKLKTTKTLAQLKI